MSEKEKKPTPSPGSSPTSYYEDYYKTASPNTTVTPNYEKPDSTPSPVGTPTSYSPEPPPVPPKAVKPKTVSPPVITVKKTEILDHRPIRAKIVNRQIRILYVISTTRIGGGETALKRLLRNLDPEYYTTEVLVTGEKGPLDQEYKLFSGGINYLEEQDLETVLNRRAKTGKYDYIHFFNLFKIYEMLPTLQVENPNLRIVSSLMVNPDMFKGAWKNHYNTIRENEGYLYAQIVDSVSAKKLFPNATVIKNGVNLETFSPSSKKKPKTVAWVGRISTAKKARLIPQIAKRLPDYQFTMIGGEKTEEYNEIMTADGLKPTQNLKILIGLSEREVADILAESQYMLFTSHGESLPISVLEGMASECCVIAERVGDLPYLIQDGVNGHLIPEEKNVVVWVHTQIKSLNTNVGEAARIKIISEHNIDNTVKQHEFIYGGIGSHHNQTRIAFVWGYQQSYEREYWNTKIDSLQHSIQELSKNNIIQIILPTKGTPRREIVLGQNICFVDEGNKEEFMSELRAFNPHMIFMSMFHENMWPKIVSAFPGVWKAVMHYGSTILRIPFADKLNAVLVQMEYLRPLVAKASNIPLEKVHHIPFCIEQWLFKPKKTTKEYMGVMLADFRKDVKRQDLLIKAWKNIPGRLLLIGRFERSLPRDYHEDCMKLASRLGIRDRITFQDGCPHTQIPDLLNKAQIGFLTSSHEGGSRALKEMMACGLPCVVLSDCAGNINMIKDGVDGLIADPTPESIAEKTAKLVNLQVSMGKAGSERMRKTYPYHLMHGIIRNLIVDARPEVSILTTSMNRVSFIEDTIKSVMTQKTSFSYKINHIVMDGGSTDGTLDTLRKHRRSIHYYIRRDNGQTNSLNQAMKFIEQQFNQTLYIGWINADDYYLPNWLQDSLTQLRREPKETALVCADMQRVGDHTGILHHIDAAYIDLNILASRGNMVGQPTVLIRMAQFRAVKNKYGFYFNPRNDYVQDLELWYRFLSSGYKIRKLSGITPTVCLRSHKDQMSRTHTEQQIDERDPLMREISRVTGIENPAWVRGELTVTGFKVNVDKLWSDSYLRGGEYSHLPTQRAFGESFQETVKVFESGVELPFDEYPVSKYHLSDLYGRLTGRSGAGKAWLKVYIGLFKKLYESISTHGYDTKKSIINVFQLRGDGFVVSDGHKRFAIIKALGKQKEILVKLDDKSMVRKSCDKLINKRLDQKMLSEGGKPILYQPIVGYDWCNGPIHTKAYYDALESIIRFCGPVKGKTFLDVGSCYGFFCFELAKRGAYTIGVDNDRDRVALSLNLSTLYNFDWSNPKFVRAEIIDYIKETGLHFDCALMFSVLHNMLGVNARLAWKALNLIAEKSDTVVLSMGHLTPGNTVNSQYDIPKLIMSNSILNECKFLGILGGRHIYGFWK